MDGDETMMCYKDITFCPYYMECGKGIACVRALTPAIISQANKAQLYISQYASKPKCIIKKKGNKNDK